MSDLQLNPFERVNYYPGQLVTPADLRAEQDYLNGKRHLINRFWVGGGEGGVLAGLIVHKEKSSREIRIEPGVAIDKKGREIVVTKEVKEEIGEMEGQLVYVCLQYDESPVDVTDACSSRDKKYNRIRESFKVLIKDQRPQDDSVQIAEISLDRDNNISSGDIITPKYVYSNAELYEFITNMEEKISKMEDKLTRFLEKRGGNEEKDQTS